MPDLPTSTITFLFTDLEGSTTRWEQHQQAMQAELWDETADSLRVRMALHTGAVEQRDRYSFRPPLNHVARFLSAGHGGQGLLSLAAQQLVCDPLPPVADLAHHQTVRL